MGAAALVEGGARTKSLLPVSTSSLSGFGGFKNTEVENEPQALIEKIVGYLSNVHKVL